MKRRLAKYRFYRFVRWYHRLRRNPLDPDSQVFNAQLPRLFAVRVAWHWSSDLRAFLRRPPKETA